MEEAKRESLITGYRIMNMKFFENTILITGAAGFIGAALAERLLAETDAA